GDWPEKVFKYPTGKMVEVTIDNFPEAKKSYLPPLPKSKPRYGDLVKQANRKIAKEKPWSTGLYEGIITVDMVFNQKLEQKNRICLILLDSVLEIAFKEFLVNDSGQNYADAALLRLFNIRNDVHNEIKKYINIDDKIWKKIDYYYRLRCKLIHERVTVAVDDTQIEDYRGVVEKVLRQLFKLQF
ncbi:ATP-binding protein, partial [Candidatus Bathyarchaeota archaeon]|nr:ATP-binding protein [Candidatus Bathyarchaeota archaeon]